MEDITRFLPLILFVLTIFIDKSYKRKQRRERREQQPFPFPLPEEDEEPGPQQPEKVLRPKAANKKKNRNIIKFEDGLPKEKPAEAKPWYVEFPEDAEQKERGRVYTEQPQSAPAYSAPQPPKSYNVYNEPAFIAAVPEDYFARTPAPPMQAAAKRRRPVFNGRLDRPSLRRAVVMAQLLDKPRALEPYRDPY